MDCRPRKNLYGAISRRHLVTGAALLAAAMTAPTVPAGVAQTPADPEEPGILGPTSYQSPQFGYRVEWDTPWILARNPGVAAGATEPGSWDSLDLQLDDEPPGTSMLSVIGQSMAIGEGDSPAEKMQLLLDFWNSDDYAGGSTVEILLSDVSDTHAAALMTIEGFTGRDLRLVEVTVAASGDYAISASLRTAVDRFAELLLAAQHGVTINDVAPFSILDAQEIAASVANTSDATPVATPEVDAATYLADVRDHYNALDASLDRFFILIDEEHFNDQAGLEIGGIFELWEKASLVSRDRIAPAGLSAVQETYVAYTDALGASATAFTAYFDAVSGSTAQTEALDTLAASLEDTRERCVDLDALLTAENA